MWALNEPSLRMQVVNLNTGAVSIEQVPVSNIVTPSNPVSELTDRTTGLPSIPQKNYSLIVVDPPWTYSLRESDRTHRGRTPYPNMSDADILNLPIGKIAAQNAYLFLWVTNNHFPLGFQCLETWGFSYKTTFTWLKTTKNSTSNEIKLRIGVGHYGRSCTEHFLIATKGKPRSFTGLGLTSIPNVILAPRSDHSRKPEEFFAIANRLKIGGYLLHQADAV
jgi:N6-adenosine-specific RNA methylase IME4